MQTKTNAAPTEMTEATLDDISGGPHWQTWDPPTYLVPAEEDDTRARGHYTQVAWAKTR